MKKQTNIKRDALSFIITMAVALLILAGSIIKTAVYNSVHHQNGYSGAELFSKQDAGKGSVGFHAESRDSTWSKAFDLNNEGITDHNYQAYTVDFYINNNTRDEVKDFSFKLSFAGNTFLLSAWNGSLEIHQKTGEDIPFIARIICVADSYDAMNTNRVYRNKLSKERIIEELEKCKGKQFDPKIADIMISLIENDELEGD